MSERKPPGQSFEFWIERSIREATERGDFDNLPGEGKPLKGLDRTHDENWWVKDYLKREGVTITSPSVQLRRDIDDLLANLSTEPIEDTVRLQVRDLNRRITAANRTPLDGPSLTFTVLDEDEIVQRWRQGKGDSADVPPR